MNVKKIFFVMLFLAAASFGLAAPVTDASAQIKDALAGLDITSQCLSAIATIALNQDFLKCIPLTAVIPLLPIVTDPNFFNDFSKDPAGTFKKDEQAFVTFSKGLCAAPKCSDKLISDSLKSIQSGCKDDLDKKNPIISTLVGVFIFYSPTRDDLCFVNDKGTFCWDETMQTIFSLPKSPVNITGDPLIDSVAVSEPAKICTSCNKAMLNTLNNYINAHKEAQDFLAGLGIGEDKLKQAVIGADVKCGATFLDGQAGDPTKPPKCSD